MKLLIITQNEPFYLKNNLKYLKQILPSNSCIIGCVVNDVSPFGKKETFLEKTIKTFRIFGLNFFLYYSFKYIYVKVFTTSLKSFLKKTNIPEIPIYGSINSKENLKVLGSYNPDLIISILGNQIFKQPIIDLPLKGCINLHTALLPKYRGLMPTFWVLKNNEKFTGVSVFFIDEGIDSGPIIVQKKVEIGKLSQAELIKKTKRIGMEAIAEAVELISNDKVKLIPNPKSEMSYFSFPTRKDVLEFKMINKKFF